ncbi:hypothetical protein D1614_00695 [Maribellus luteus]|uniref:Uncharacterized protein n=1 Tax=Maribellus luteus TaxID=2305463 RepID=A0A399T2E0_9BACT|nr:hypothetical protein D1614_00695 [Maribellus luteus]
MKNVSNFYSAKMEQTDSGTFNILFYLIVEDHSAKAFYRKLSIAAMNQENHPCSKYHGGRRRAV